MAKQLLDDLIAIRVSKELKDRLIKKADSAGLSLSKYVLGLLYLYYGHEFEEYQEIKRLKESGKLDELSGIDISCCDCRLK